MKAATVTMAAVVETVKVAVKTMWRWQGGDNKGGDYGGSNEKSDGGGG
jgi:hypothetical protein